MGTGSCRSFGMDRVAVRPVVFCLQWRECLNRSRRFVYFFYSVPTWLLLSRKQKKPENKVRFRTPILRLSDAFIFNVILVYI
jgi:hypothetical protein